MLHKAINQARDLAPPIKAALETLLGQPLQDDEQVSVRVFHRHPAPQDEAWRKAAHGLEKQLDRIAGKVKDVSQDEMEAAIDEATARARPRRP
jgi:hypothetical protein